MRSSDRIVSLDKKKHRMIYQIKLLNNIINITNSINAANTFSLTRMRSEGQLVDLLDVARVNTIVAVMKANRIAELGMAILSYYSNHSSAQKVIASRIS